MLDDEDGPDFVACVAVWVGIAWRRGGKLSSFEVDVLYIDSESIGVAGYN